MSGTLIAIDSETFQALHRDVQEIKRQLTQPQIQPVPEWLPVADYADLVGKSPRTVMRRIQDRTVKSCTMAGVIMVRVSPDVLPDQPQTRCNRSTAG